MDASRKPLICFLDDDPRELARLAKALGNRFEVVTATTWAGCQEALRKRNRARPDLWLLDLYFPQSEGAANAPDELNLMNRKYLQLHEATREFRAFLESIGQGPAGGLALLEKCRAAGGPVVMFTRKGTLEDALRCLDRGAAAVLRKPMPPQAHALDSPEAIRDALDAALLEQSAQLARRLEALIRQHSHWARRRGLYLLGIGLAAGAVLAWVVRLLTAG